LITIPTSLLFSTLQQVVAHMINSWRTAAVLLLQEQEEETIAYHYVIGIPS
jgi:hypothetical protein